MVSKLELRVRELDDECEGVTDAARRIAQKLNHNKGYIFNILIAKRKGFKSLTEYKKGNLEKRGVRREIDYRNLLAKRKDYPDHNSYLGSLVVKRGFFDANEYKNFIKMRKKGRYLTQRDFVERAPEIEKTGYSLEFFNQLPSDKLSIEQSVRLSQANSSMYEILLTLVNQLEPKYRKVIQGRFFEQKTLEEIGKNSNITRERVRQIESEALIKLYLLAKKSELEEMYSSRGEII